MSWLQIADRKGQLVPRDLPGRKGYPVSQGPRVLLGFVAT
jgi:hypothetical protein